MKNKERTTNTSFLFFHSFKEISNNGFRQLFRFSAKSEDNVRAAIGYIKSRADESTLTLGPCQYFELISQKHYMSWIFCKNYFKWRHLNQLDELFELLISKFIFRFI